MAENRSAEDVQRAVQLVEQTIGALGVDPAGSRSQRDGHTAYALRRGSVRILIAVHAPSAELREGRLRVVAPVIRVADDVDLLSLYRFLLEANAHDLVGAAFGISDADVVVVAERSVTDLDASEVDAMIRNVGRVADRYDDELARVYGAKRSSDG